MSALLSNVVSGRAVRWPTFSLVIVFALLLGACSAMRIGYNNADSLIVFSLDDYLDLSSEQSDLARERAGALMNWHRSTQLRDYAQVIDAARARIEGPVTASEVLTFNEALNNRLAAVGDQAAPDLAQLALTLSQAQLDRLTRKLTSDTSKARRELVKFAGKETIDDRVKRYAERVEDWFGSVSPAQREVLRSALLQRPAAAEWWIDERERRQRELIRVLRRIQSEQPSTAVATTWLRGYFAELRSSSDAQRRAKMEEFRRTNAELIATLINSASPAQRAHLSAKLGGYAEDFSALAEARISQPG
jgi:hypothetical protein